MKNATVTVKQVLNLLTKQNFADWYNNGNFDAYITGEAWKQTPSEEQIIEELAKMLGVSE